MHGPRVRGCVRACCQEPPPPSAIPRFVLCQHHRPPGPAVFCFFRPGIDRWAEREGREKPVRVRGTQPCACVRRRGLVAAPGCSPLPMPLCTRFLRLCLMSMSSTTALGLRRHTGHARVTEHGFYAASQRRLPCYDPRLTPLG